MSESDFGRIWDFEALSAAGEIVASRRLSGVDKVAGWVATLEEVTSVRSVRMTKAAGDQVFVWTAEGE